MTPRTFRAADPVRLLNQWRNAGALRKWEDVGTGERHHIEAHDLEPCDVTGRMVAVVFHGCGRTLAEAADQCLTAIANHRENP